MLVCKTKSYVLRKNGIDNAVFTAAAIEQIKQYFTSIGSTQKSAFFPQLPPFTEFKTMPKMAPGKRLKGLVARRFLFATTASNGSLVKSIFAKLESNLTAILCFVSS